MPNKSVYCFIALTLFLFCKAVFALTTETPVGYWKTIDDVTGQAKSVVQIFPSDNDVLYGRVIRLFKDQNKLCSECSDWRKNKPIRGMVIMEGFKHSKSNPSLWTNGKILDPKNGKIYRCNIQLLEKNSKLLVRGYIGIPLFGRSQTWMRVQNPQK